MEEVRNIFEELISTRSWYSGTTINRFQANELKRRFKSGELSLGKMIEVLIQCGYKVFIEKP